MRAGPPPGRQRTRRFPRFVAVGRMVRARPRGVKRLPPSRASRHDTGYAAEARTGRITMNAPTATLVQPATEARHVHVLKQLETQAAVAVGVDDPQRQPHPAEPRRAEGGRPPGVLRVVHLDHGGAVFRDRPAAGPDRGEAARRAGVPRDQLSVRPAERGEDGGAAPVRRRPAVSVARQGRRRGRFLHRVGRAGRGDDERSRR